MGSRQTSQRENRPELSYARGPMHVLLTRHSIIMQQVDLFREHDPVFWLAACARTIMPHEGKPCKKRKRGRQRSGGWGVPTPHTPSKAKQRQRKKERKSGSGGGTTFEQLPAHEPVELASFCQRIRQRQTSCCGCE